MGEAWVVPHGERLMLHPRSRVLGALSSLVIAGLLWSAPAVGQAPPAPEDVQAPPAPEDVPVDEPRAPDAVEPETEEEGEPREGDGTEAGDADGSDPAVDRPQGPPAPESPPVPEPPPAPEVPEASEATAVTEGAAGDELAVTTTRPGDASLVEDGDEAPGDHVPSFLRALRLGGDSLMIGGYIQPGFFYQADTEFNQDDQDGFDFANARLTGRGDLDLWYGLGAGFRFNFDVNQGNFSVRDVYGILSWAQDEVAEGAPRPTARVDAIAVDAGQLKQPFGLSLLQSEAKLQFPLSTPIRIIAFGRDQGARLRAQVELGPVWIRLMGMVANGEGGFRQRRNLDNRFQYTARIDVAPFGEMELSEGELKDRDFQLTVGGNIGHTPSLGKGLGLGDVGAREERYGGDLRMWFRGASLRGEFIYGQRAENGGARGFGRYAVSVQGGYVLPLPLAYPQFEPVLRYVQYDVNNRSDGVEGTDYIIDNTRVRVIEPGLNIYLFEHAAKLLMSYRLTDLLEGPRTDENGDVIIGDAFLTYFSFAFL